jgi:hypothetical protein
MKSLTFAYRDDDRTPVIFAIREMAKRYDDLDVTLSRIHGVAEYEAALFNGSADVIIEHLEYLYEEAAQGEEDHVFLRAEQRRRARSGRASTYPGCEGFHR